MVCDGVGCVHVCIKVQARGSVSERKMDKLKMVREREKRRSMIIDNIYLRTEGIYYLWYDKQLKETGLASPSMRTHKETEKTVVPGKLIYTVLTLPWQLSGATAWTAYSLCTKPCSRVHE